MKSIECRGYCLNCEAWVYGYYVVANENTHWIVQMNCFGKLLKNETHRVDPETVGQYTGLLDKAGNDMQYIF